MRLQTNQYKTDENRIFGLDILRAFAITLVVMGHGKFMLNNTIMEGFPFFRMIDGVDIFFVLSGFLIGGILLKQLQGKSRFEWSDLRLFWKRRWFRTLPNYYLILLANYLVVKTGIIKEDINQFNFHFLTFTQNFKDPFYGFFWESWSLSIEEWFYLITPILIVIFTRLFKADKAYLCATILMILLPLIYRYTQFNPDIDAFTWDISIRKTVLSRLDSIGYGLLAAWVYRYRRSWWNEKSNLLGLVGILAVSCVLLIKRDLQTMYMQTLYFSLVPISAMLFLPIASKIKSARGRFAIAIQHVSKISYSMYLINLALVAEVIRDNFAPEGGFDGVLKYLIYWTIVVLVSSFLYKYFEKPVMDLRDYKWSKKR